MSANFKTPRASSKRTIQFGLLRVDVGSGPLSDATTRRAANIINPETLNKGKQQYVDSVTGEVIETTAKGFAHGDTFVVLEKDELPKLKADGVLTLAATIDDADVPNEFIEKTALIWPTDDASLMSFSLVLAFLRDERKAFIGTTIDGGTTKTMIVRYSRHAEALVMHTAGYVANIRKANVDLVKGAVATAKVPEGATDMAKTLFSALPDTFDYETVEDEYAKALDVAIEAKSKGLTVKVEESVAAAPEMDVMAMLQASLEQVEKTA